MMTMMMIAMVMMLVMLTMVLNILMMITMTMAMMLMLLKTIMLGIEMVIQEMMTITAIIRGGDDDNDDDCKRFATIHRDRLKFGDLNTLRFGSLELVLALVFVGLRTILGGLGCFGLVLGGAVLEPF